MNVYDFDKTIYDGDSTMHFYLFCLRRHPRIFPLAVPLVRGAIKYYVLNRGTKTMMKEKMYRFLLKIDSEPASAISPTSGQRTGAKSSAGTSSRSRRATL